MCATPLHTRQHHHQQLLTLFELLDALPLGLADALLPAQQLLQGGSEDFNFGPWTVGIILIPKVLLMILGFDYCC